MSYSVSLWKKDILWLNKFGQCWKVCLFSLVDSQMYISNNKCSEKSSSKNNNNNKTSFVLQNTYWKTLSYTLKQRWSIERTSPEEMCCTLWYHRATGKHFPTTKHLLLLGFIHIYVKQWVFYKLMSERRVIFEAKWDNGTLAKWHGGQCMNPNYMWALTLDSRL